MFLIYVGYVRQHLLRRRLRNELSSCSEWSVVEDRGRSLQTFCPLSGTNLGNQLPKTPPHATFPFLEDVSWQVRARIAWKCEVSQLKWPRLLSADST